MIHPSTMAGPNWFTGSFGTTNPFQQTSPTFFRNTPFQGPQGGFGPGNTLFQTQPFGLGSTIPFQTMISEIVRQTVPNSLAGFGFPNTGFQTPFGTPGTLSFQNPWSFQSPMGLTQFGPPYPTSEWINPGFFSEIIRQATNQAIQNTWQSNPLGFNTFASSPTSPFFGFGTTGQTQDLTSVIAQVSQQACQQVCQTLIQAVTTCVNECLNTQNISPNTPFGTPMSLGTNWQQQNIGPVVAQVCQQACQQACQTLIQAVTTCVNESLNTQNRSQNIPFGISSAGGFNPQQQYLGSSIAQVCQQACQQVCQTLIQAVTTCVSECLNTQSRSQSTPLFGTANIPFRTPGTPFGFNNTTSQYSFTPGIPTGAGAF